MSLRNSREPDRHGFTLIEVMVAIVILMIGLLGMFQAVNMAIDKNVENQLRQKAVSVAEQQMNDLKSRTFDIITASGVSGYSVTVASVAAFKNISVVRQVTTPAASNPQTKQVAVRVWWRYHGRPYEHQVASGIGVTEIGSGR